MAQFHPPVRPDLLSDRWRDAESEVWESFRQLDNSWHVFYSARANSDSGYDREVDFILIRLNQIFYCEVKGGLVQVDQRFGPGVTWKHTKRSGEPIEKRVDPQQLLNAKAALTATIRKMIGATPYELGFLEHNCYIFPHTSRDVTGGANFERGAFHYAFAEDMVMLPYRLQQIVAVKTRAYVHPDKLGAVIAALDRMVIKGGGWSDVAAVPVQPSWEAAPSSPHSPTYGSSYGSTHGYSTWSDTSLLKRVLSYWRYAAFGIAGLYLLFQTVPFLQPVPTAEPVKPAARPQSAVTTTLNAASKVTATTSSEALSPGRKASQARTERSESALPIFIPPVAFTDVEQAVMLARDIDANVPWRTGSHHGFVTLTAVEPGGCRRWRVSRNDLATTFDFVRRC